VKDEVNELTTALDIITEDIKDVKELSEDKISELDNLLPKENSKF